MKDKKAVLLPTADPAAFALYMDFIHSESIFLGSEDKSVDEEISTLGPAYVLGNILSDHDFKDAIVDAIIHHVKGTENYPFELNQFVFEKTPAEWPLRKLLTHLLILRAKSTWLTDASKALLTTDALFEALKYLFQVQEKQSTPDFSLAYHVCNNYHSHAQYNAKCYRERLGLASLLSGPFSLTSFSPAVKESAAPPIAPISFACLSPKSGPNPLMIKKPNTFGTVTKGLTSTASKPSSGDLVKFTASQAPNLLSGSSAPTASKPSSDLFGVRTPIVASASKASQPSSSTFAFGQSTMFPTFTAPEHSDGGPFGFGVSAVVTASKASQPSRRLSVFGTSAGTTPFSTSTALQSPVGLFGSDSSAGTSVISSASTFSFGGSAIGNFATTTPQLDKKAKQTKPGRTTTDKRATRPCRYHAKGDCRTKDSCPYLHD